MTDPLYWQLEYHGGRLVTEPPENLSIRAAPPHATGLRLVRPDGTPVIRIDLTPGDRPVCYRRRSAALDGSGSTRLAATVFGRVREGTVSVLGDACLWAAIGGQIVDCPTGLIDTAMLTLQLERD